MPTNSESKRQLFSLKTISEKTNSSLKEKKNMKKYTNILERFI